MAAVDFAVAFAAGVISFFSPCSVSVLPAFISYYIGREDEDREPSALGAGPRGFVGGLGLVLVGGVLAVGGIVHNIADLDRSRLFDVAAVALGVGIVALGLVLLILTRRSAPREVRSAYVKSARRGLGFGLLATLGFGIAYGGVGGLAALTLSGVAIGVAGSDLAGALPWVSMAAASAIIVLGILLALGRSPTIRLPGIRAPRARGAAAPLFFGAAYALISISCLLPVFLSVLVRAFSLTPVESVLVLLVMAAGSGLLMTVTATYVALAKQTSIRILRRFRPHVGRIAGMLVVAFALYTVYYDLTTFFGFG